MIRPNELVGVLLTALSLVTGPTRPAAAALFLGIRLVVDGPQPLGCVVHPTTAEVSLRARKLRQRFVAVAAVAVLNAAWFFAAGCAALCALGSCPRQHAPVTEERCHHSRQVPAPQQDHSSPRSPCQDHGYLAATVVPMAAPDRTPGLQNGTPVSGLPYLLRGTAIRSVPIRDMLSHSPPGLVTGRLLLQKESLLRI
jgi:hypothetical protein